MTTVEAIENLTAIVHRAYTGATTIAFLNNGGRSKLMLMDCDGNRHQLCWTISKTVNDAIEAAAHDYAKATYGARRNWPFRIDVSLAAVDAAA